MGRSDRPALDLQIAEGVIVEALPELPVLGLSDILEFKAASCARW